jgi:hypothetical protein
MRDQEEDSVIVVDDDLDLKNEIAENPAREDQPRTNMSKDEPILASTAMGDDQPLKNKFMSSEERIPVTVATGGEPTSTPLPEPFSSVAVEKRDGTLGFIPENTEDEQSNPALAFIQGEFGRIEKDLNRYTRKIRSLIEEKGSRKRLQKLIQRANQSHIYLKDLIRDVNNTKSYLPEIQRISDWAQDQKINLEDVEDPSENDDIKTLSNASSTTMHEPETRRGTLVKIEEKSITKPTSRPESRKPILLIRNLPPLPRQTTKKKIDDWMLPNLPRPKPAIVQEKREDEMSEAKSELKIKTTIAQLKVKQETQRYQEEIELQRAQQELEKNRCRDELDRLQLEQELIDEMSSDNKSQISRTKSHNSKKLQPSPWKEMLASRREKVEFPVDEPEDQKQIQRFFQGIAKPHLKKYSSDKDDYEDWRQQFDIFVHQAKIPTRWLC